MSEDNPLSAGEQRLAELAVVEGSDLDGASLAKNNFIQRYRLVVLALHRQGRDLWHASENLQDLTLQPGDVLLVQGHNQALETIKQSTELLLLDQHYCSATHRQGVARSWHRYRHHRPSGHRRAAHRYCSVNWHRVDVSNPVSTLVQQSVP